MFKRTAAEPAVVTAPERETAEAAAAHADYVTQVTLLVEDQRTVLLTLMTEAAAHASTADQPIVVTRVAEGLAASMGARSAVFRIEAITDRPADMGRARTYMVGQARCILPSTDGPAAEWVVALPNGAGTRQAHVWMDAKALQPVTAAMVTSALQAVFA